MEARCGHVSGASVHLTSMSVISSSAQEELVSATAFRYITDAITPDEALKMLKEKEATKAEREKHVREVG